MNLTDFRKTMETWVDPRLPVMLFCLVTVFSLVIVRVKSRQIVPVKHANYPQLLKRAELPTLLNRRLQDICILMYKVKHKLCMSNLYLILSITTILLNLYDNRISLFLDIIL